MFSLSRREISQITTVFHVMSRDLPNHHGVSCHILDISESSRGAPTCLRLFGATMWKLLIIEPFFQWKLNKIKTENCIEFWGCSCYCWKAPKESDLIKFISQFSELRYERYWFFKWILFLEIQTNCKNWVWKEKISSALNVFTLLNLDMLKMWKIKDVFTLGPTTQGTLLLNESRFFGK